VSNYKFGGRTMKPYVIVLVCGLQVILATVALWVLYSAKASSEQFSRQYDGRPLEFTWFGLLTPVALSLTIGLSAVVNGLFRRSARSRWVTSFALLPIGLVLAWWLILLTGDYKSFFVQSGALQPNEIMGASWPLFVVVVLLSLAALLGIVSLVLHPRNSAGVT
jgi:hypothetical protein